MDSFWSFQFPLNLTALSPSFRCIMTLVRVDFAPCHLKSLTPSSCQLQIDFPSPGQSSGGTWRRKRPAQRWRPQWEQSSHLRRRIFPGGRGASIPSREMPWSISPTQVTSRLPPLSLRGSWPPRVWFPSSTWLLWISGLLCPHFQSVWPTPDSPPGSGKDHPTSKKLAHKASTSPQPLYSQRGVCGPPHSTQETPKSWSGS